MGHSQGERELSRGSDTWKGEGVEGWESSEREKGWTVLGEGRKGESPEWRVKRTRS